jgi:hypothetical protein
MSHATVRIYTNEPETILALAVESSKVVAHARGLCDTFHCPLTSAVEVIPRSVNAARLVAWFICPHVTEDCITHVRLASQLLEDESEKFSDVLATTKMMPLYKDQEPSVDTL